MADLCYIKALQEEKGGGFNFDNLRRNAQLFQRAPPSNLSAAQQDDENAVRSHARKTGTTICGVMTKDSVVLGADTRATEGPIVADKACEKLHYLANNIWAAGAGTAADLNHTAALMESRLELLRLSTGRQPRVAAAVTMLGQLLFGYQGYIGCALVLGGVDCHGPHLYNIYPHGSTDRLPFCAMGSGSLNALAVLEAGFQEEMTVEEGKQLVARAIRSGISNDLGSGGNVDLVVIGRDGTQMFRGFACPHPRLFRNPQPVTFPRGTTPVLLETLRELRRHVVVDTTDVEMATA